MNEQKTKVGFKLWSSASPLSWRRLGRFFAVTVLASFVSNELWEMAQMSAYVDTAGRSWTSTLGLCTRAMLVEHAALVAGRWSYTESMPIVSVLGAGLWPLLQMTLLPPITFLFAR